MSYGYPDYSREYNNSGELIYNLNAEWGNGANTGKQFVGQYSYTLVMHDKTSTTHYDTLQIVGWPYENASTGFVYSYVQSNPGYLNVFPVANKFPYMSVIGSNFGVANSDNSELYLNCVNNIAQLSGGDLLSSALLNQLNVLLGPGNTQAVGPFGAWGGVASVSVQTSLATSTGLTIQQLSQEGGSWLTVNRSLIAAANTAEVFDCPLPWSPWRAVLFNAAASGNTTMELVAQAKQVAVI